MNNITIGELAGVSKSVDMRLVAKIVDRAEALSLAFPGSHIERIADIAQVAEAHNIDMVEWLIADDLEFAREYWSIGRYLNHETKVLEGYIPYFARTA